MKCTCDVAKKEHPNAICSHCFLSGAKKIEGDVQFVCYSAHGLNILHKKAGNPAARSARPKMNDEQAFLFYMASQNAWPTTIGDIIRKEQSDIREANESHIRTDYWSEK